MFTVEFFCFPCNEPISGIRAVSIHRSVARVEHNGFVGVDAFIVYSCEYFAILRDGGMKWPGLTLHDRVS